MQKKSCNFNWIYNFQQAQMYAIKLVFIDILTYALIVRLLLILMFN